MHLYGRPRSYPSQTPVFVWIMQVGGLYVSVGFKGWAPYLSTFLACALGGLVYGGHAGRR